MFVILIQNLFLSLDLPLHEILNSYLLRLFI